MTMSNIAYKGATLPLYFGPVTNATDRRPVNLTGATVTCKAKQIAPTAGSEVTAASAGLTSNPVNGDAVAEFSSAQTGLWTADTDWRVDAIATLGDGRVVPLGTIDFTVRELLSVG